MKLNKYEKVKVSSLFWTQLQSELLICVSLRLKPDENAEVHHVTVLSQMLTTTKTKAMLFENKRKNVQITFVFDIFNIR